MKINKSYVLSGVLLFIIFTCFNVYAAEMKQLQVIDITGKWDTHHVRQGGIVETGVTHHPDWRYSYYVYADGTGLYKVVCNDGWFKGVSYLIDSRAGLLSMDGALVDKGEVSASVSGKSILIKINKAVKVSFQGGVFMSPAGNWVRIAFQ